ncbi:MULTISPECIES: hypothetical protein [Chitinophaga]|uniref:hypothetical protein n=1 Tax=Chitinophaga TaxID=79328 RepID=UPI0009CCF57B|nr:MULTISPECIES: hypothetical protein [Chitinophaga]OMP75301.1 hypothetical protein BW716_30965 [[Flexibacter] sp. ATCC 35208]WPQ62645.1 hypothetical protein SIO70_30240 [Chitinophaga sancti]WPV67012.1 hypothetical protein QQL36_35045 [Chitinophaga sp. LS1]
MSKVENHRGKLGNTSKNRPKSKEFSRKISQVAAKRAVHNNQLSTLAYKELVRKHSAAIALLCEQEEDTLDYVILGLQQMKADKL